METNVHFSSASGNWSTPQDFFDKLDEEFHFTLDPCADGLNHKCEKYYTEDQDGLKQDWSGEIVFCNPPYGRDVPKWVQKCFNEVYAGKCKCAVMLLNGGLIRDGFTIISTEEPRSDSSRADLNSVDKHSLRRSRQWWLYSEV